MEMVHECSLTDEALEWNEINQQTIQQSYSM